MALSVTILGARGSVPVSGAQFSRYGGATTCALFEADGDAVVLDAGSGLLFLPPEAMERPSLPLLLSHPHADHLLGLPMCPYVMLPGRRLDVYAAERGGLDARAQAGRLLSPPLWPVGTEALPAEIRFHALPRALRLGAVGVDVLEGEHPGGVSVFRLEADGKSVVFATDVTLGEAFAARLAAFARDCDLLLCDGQYTDEEWARFPGFGHSSWNAAANLARECGAKRLRIIHHAPFRTDGELDAAAAALRETDPNFDFAREGERISL